MTKQARFSILFRILRTNQGLQCQKPGLLINKTSFSKFSSKEEKENLAEITALLIYFSLFFPPTRTNVLCVRQLRMAKRRRSADIDSTPDKLSMLKEH